jgi:drug/metabolite transporter (DMT)-like permease
LADFRGFAAGANRATICRKRPRQAAQSGLCEGGVAQEAGVTNWKNIGLLIVLGVGWGSTQPLGKIAASTGQGAFGLIFWQLVICVLVLGAISAVRGKGLVFTRPAFSFYTIVALLGTLIPNFTFYTSVATLPAGIMSILISTVPLMAFPMAMALRIDRFEVKRLIGLLLGLCGVALIALPQSSLPDRSMVAYLPVAMLGPFFYAMEGTYVARNGMAGMDPVQAMFGASVVGVVLCLPMVLISGQWFNPLATWGIAEEALLLSSVLHSMLYATYVGLAARAGAVFATQTSYIVTAAGLCWSMLILGERFPPTIWSALVVMLAGLALVQPRARLPQAG